MKKSIIYTTALASFAVLGLTGIAITNNQPAANAVDAPLETTPSLVSSLTSAQNLTTSKDETVYIIANADGETNKTFVGNTIYNGSEALPFTFSVKYYLDGTEIDAKDLAHKSGHVKIVFTYDAANYYQGKQIPFLALTGLTLDQEKFENITLDHGKLVNLGDNLALVGYAFPGINYDFATDLLWNSFTVEADTTDFELPVTYSVLTNEVFADLDTSKLSDLDSLVSSINELSSGLGQIITGASSLESGLKTLADKSTELVAGVDKLSSGLTELTNYNETLNTSAASIYQVLSQIPTVPTELLENYQVFETYLETYTAGVEQAAAGAAELKEKLPALIAGETELVAGSEQLTQGLTTFKSTGIDKLVSFANQDLASFTKNARATVSAAASYRHFSNDNATSVKFIVKTSSIK